MSEFSTSQSSSIRCPRDPNRLDTEDDGRDWEDSSTDNDWHGIRWANRDCWWTKQRSAWPIQRLSKFVHRDCPKDNRKRRESSIALVSPVRQLESTTTGYSPDAAFANARDFPDSYLWKESIDQERTRRERSFPHRSTGFRCIAIEEFAIDRD